MSEKKLSNSEAYAAVGDDAFGEDALLDAGLPLVERRQGLLALRRLLHGASVKDATSGLEHAAFSIAGDVERFVATGPPRAGGGEPLIRRLGASPEEALARALAEWISLLTRIIAERRVTRAIELGRLAGAVAATVEGAKAGAGHLKGLKEDP